VRRSSPSPAPDAILQPVTDLRSAPVPPLAPDDHVRGAGDTVIAYMDFTCPRCAAEHERLRTDGARVVLRHFALRARHPRALALAHAAEAAAAQDAFWAFADAVYADQGRLDDPHLWAHCQTLGLDVARFDSDRRSDRAAQRVQRDVRDALRAGLTTTPALLTQP
jgi:protein-disulfide isomerase